MCAVFAIAQRCGFHRWAVAWRLLERSGLTDDSSNHAAITTGSPRPSNGPLSKSRESCILVPDVNEPRTACMCGLPLSLGALFLKGMEGENVTNWLRKLWAEEEGQDIAEYAVMMAVILVIVVGTIRLIGGNANNVFSSVSSSIAG